MKLLSRIFLLAGLLAAGLVTNTAHAGSCAAQVAQWLDPASGKIIDSSKLFDRVGDQAIVLLGEVHDNPAHHRWQHYAMSALHSRNVNMVVGFEMLPRRLQPVLDDWSAGELDDDRFLEQTEWDQVWGYDPDLYLPLFQFAREHRLPTVALNVDRSLVSRVGMEGWDAIDKGDRLGVGDPAAASEAYRRDLAELFGYKMMLRGHGESSSEAVDVDEVMQSEAFANFVDAQLTWDRAMAEALADAHRLDPEALIVGIVGRGHLEYGWGIPHQLADLGIEDVAVLLPVAADSDCTEPEAGLADAVFVVEARTQPEPPARPRLGVMIEGADDGVRVMEVVDNSVAADSGLRAGDVIQSAAGFETSTTTELVEIIQRQAPGTWLPLQVLRDGDRLDITARFPQRFD